MAHRKLSPIATSSAEFLTHKFKKLYGHLSTERYVHDILGTRERKLFSTLYNLLFGDLKEEMKTSEFIIVIFLLVTFFWAGQSTNAPGTDIWVTVKDLLQLVAGFLTLLIAYKALNTWKVQHVHIEKYKAVVAIEKSVHNFHSTFRHYTNSASHQRRVKTDGTSHPGLNKIADKEPELSEKLSHDASLLFDSIDWAETFLSPEELNKIKDNWRSVVASLNEYTNCHSTLMDEIRVEETPEIELAFYDRYLIDMGVIERKMKKEVDSFKANLLMMR